MLTFLVRIVDENPTIYLIISCSTFLLWLYFVHDEFFTTHTDQKQSIIYCLPQKTKNQTILSDCMRTKIPWINNGKRAVHMIRILIC